MPIAKAPLQNDFVVGAGGLEIGTQEDVVTPDEFFELWKVHQI
jgi:hypothetical protein